MAQSVQFTPLADELLPQPKRQESEREEDERLVHAGVPSDPRQVVQGVLQWPLLSFDGLDQDAGCDGKTLDALIGGC